MIPLKMTQTKNELKFVPQCIFDVLHLRDLNEVYRVAKFNATLKNFVQQLNEDELRKKAEENVRPKQLLR